MNPNTPIGDLLHHKGRLIDIRVSNDNVITQMELPFNGYTELLQTLSTIGIDVTEESSGALTLKSSDTGSYVHDLWGISSNLLQTPDGRVFGDLKTGITLNNASPASAYIYPIEKTQATYRRSFFSEFTSPDPYGIVESVDSTEVVLFQNVLVERNVSPSGRPFPVHRMTVAEVLSLDLFGDPSFPSQDTQYGKYTDRSLVLTPFGLTLKCRLSVPLTLPVMTTTDFAQFPTSGNWWNLIGRPAVLEGDSVIYSIAIRFPGYGWPTELAPAFLSPRKPRILTAPATDPVKVFFPGTGIVETQVPHHPNITSQPYGKDGIDYEIVSLSKEQMDAETTEVALLTPLPNVPVPTGDHPYDFPITPNPDSAADFLDLIESYAIDRKRLVGGFKSPTMVRMNGLQEHYNCIANLVNSIKKAIPHDLFSHPFTNSDGSTAWVRPNNIGPFGDAIRPRNHFATVVEGDPLYVWAQEHGVPIKGASDLPQSLQSLKTVNNLTRAVRRTVETRALVLTKVSGGFYWHYQTHSQMRLLSFSDIIVSQSGTLYDSFTVGAVESFRWLTVEDVRAKADELGLMFNLQRLVIPLELKVFTVGPASELFIHPSANLIEFDEEGDGFESYSVGQTVVKTTNVDANYIARIPRFVEATDDNDAEWIRDDLNGPVYLVDHHAGDVLTHTQSNISETCNMFGGHMTSDFMVIYRLTSDSRYRRDLPELNFWRPITAADPFRNIGIGVASVLVQTFTSDALNPSPSVVLSNSDSYEHDGATFSEGSYTNAIARQLFGVQSIPIKTVSSSPGALPVTINADEVMILADPNGKAQKVTYFTDYPMRFG